MNNERKATEVWSTWTMPQAGSLTLAGKGSPGWSNPAKPLDLELHLFSQTVRSARLLVPEHSSR